MFNERKGKLIKEVVNGRILTWSQATYSRDPGQSSPFPFLFSLFLLLSILMVEKEKVYLTHIYPDLVGLKGSSGPIGVIQDTYKN